MGIKVYVSGMSGNKEVKKRQQRVTMIMDSKHIEYITIDITEPGREGEKDFMQTNAQHKGCTISDPNPRHALPPQLFNDTEYCGDYDDFDLANEVDKLEVFLKLAAPAEPEVEHKNGAAVEEATEDAAALADEDENKENKTEDNTEDGAAEDDTNEHPPEAQNEAKDDGEAKVDTCTEGTSVKDEVVDQQSAELDDSQSDRNENLPAVASVEVNDKAPDCRMELEDIVEKSENKVESNSTAPTRNENLPTVTSVEVNDKAPVGRMELEDISEESEIKMESNTAAPTRNENLPEVTNVEVNDKAPDGQMKVEDISEKSENKVESNTTAPTDASKTVDANSSIPPEDKQADAEASENTLVKDTIIVNEKESDDSTEKTNIGIEEFDEEAQLEGSKAEQQQSVETSVEKDVDCDIKTQDASNSLTEEVKEPSLDDEDEYETSEDEKDSQNADNVSQLECEMDLKQETVTEEKEQEGSTTDNTDSAGSKPPIDNEVDDGDGNEFENSTHSVRASLEHSADTGKPNSKLSPPSPTVPAEESPSAAEMDAEIVGSDAEEQELLQTSAALVGKSEDSEEIEIDETTQEEETQPSQEAAGEDEISSKLVDGDDPMMAEQEQEE